MEADKETEIWYAMRATYRREPDAMRLLENEKMGCFIPMQYYHLNKCSILFQQCFMQEPWNETWPYEQSYQRLKEMLLSPYALGYVLYRDNQLIGMILGRQMTYLEK